MVGWGQGQAEHAGDPASDGRGLRGPPGGRRALKSPPARTENRGVDTSPPRPAKPLRPTVGLDKPCRKCGRPIYYNYKGPVEGLCGRCSDTTRRAPLTFARSRRIGFFHRKGRGFASNTLFVLTLLAVLGILGYLVYTFLQ